MNYNQLCAAILDLQQAEKVTKEVLGTLSREVLAYVTDSEDVRPLNQLLGANDNGFILSPVNWRIACQYFNHFIPFKSNYNDVKDCIINGGKREALVFVKKDKKNWDKKVETIDTWLANDDHDIWVWQADNVKVEAKPTDYAKRLTSAINSAIAEDKGGLSVAEVFQAILDSDIDTDTLMLAAMQDNGQQIKAAA